MPGLNLGDEFPNLELDTTVGKIYMHDFIGDEWVIFFSHPKDYTPVCTTELACVAQHASEYEKRNVRLIALSCDSVEDHKEWIKDILDYKDCPITFPIIGDPSREIAVKLGMIDPEEKDDKGMPLTARAVFIIAPDRKLKLSILYPATTGRNFVEILRVIDSLQLTMYKKVATPAEWKQGDKCMVHPAVKDEDLPKLFPLGVETRPMPSGKGYMRFTPQPEI